MAAYGLGLAPCDSTIRRSKQTCARPSLALQKTPEISEVRCVPTRLVPHGMVSPRMAFLANAFKYFGVALDVFPDAKERPLLTVLAQLVQDKRCPFRVRTIVESQVNSGTGSRPEKFRKQGGDSARNAGSIHMDKFDNVLLFLKNGCAFSHPFAGVSSRPHRAGNGI